jgi:peptide/bleomycin uptake transporter
MFHSFFPKPKLFFLSFAIYALVMIIAWNVGGDRLQFLSLGPLFGVEGAATLDAGVAPDIELPSSETVAQQEADTGWADPQTFWFYQYMLTAIALFVGFWMWYAPHPWQLWSVAGSALIFFTNWFLVQLDVMINEWFGGFYDLIQQALAEPGSIDGRDYYLGIATFLQIALVYVFVAVLFRFFVSHYVFRWRTAMNNYYTSMWKRVRKIEGASQRVQEDTMRFATITEGLGVALLDSVMTLVAFLPLLWGLSAAVTELPLIGEVSQGLVFVAIVWSILGTVLLAAVGIKLPGLEFNNQKVEAAYRKELVMGEDFVRAGATAITDRTFCRCAPQLFPALFQLHVFQCGADFLSPDRQSGAVHCARSDDHRWHDNAGHDAADHASVWSRGRLISVSGQLLDDDRGTDVGLQTSQRV